MKSIDMTQTAWGHNIETMSNDNQGHLKFAIWCRQRPEVGDELVWLVKLGTNKARIDDVQWTGNVDDMYFIKVTVTERIPYDES
jgi:hypothetical protein